MSETARVLRFPRRSRSGSLTPAEVSSRARAYLDVPASDRPAEVTSELLREPDVLFAILGILRELVEISPATVADEARDLYCLLSSSEQVVGVFDEREYLVGESARFASWGCRLLGRYADSEKWLDRAEAAYRHTVNAGPLLCNLSYARLAIRYETGRHDVVLELLPSLLRSFKKLGMQSELAKSQFLFAMALKSAGRASESVETLLGLQRDLSESDSPALLGQVLVHLGDHSGSNGRLEDALAYYQKAVPAIERSNRPIAVAELKWSLGATYCAQGGFEEGLGAYRESRNDYVKLGMATFAAKLGLAMADALLALDRPREAEWEILQALPTIEEQKMVPEGFAAVALLRESVKRRKADPNALRELREHLKKQN